MSDWISSEVLTIIFQVISKNVFYVFVLSKVMWKCYTFQVKINKIL